MKIMNTALLACLESERGPAVTKAQTKPRFYGGNLPTYVFFKNGPNPASFCLFLFFSQHNDNYSTNLTINEIKA